MESVSPFWELRKCLIAIYDLACHLWASMLFTSSSHAHAKLYMTSCCGRYLKDEQKERLPDILANAMLRAKDFAKLDPGMVARILEKMKW